MNDPSRLDHLRSWLSAALKAASGFNFRLTFSGFLEILGILAIVFGFYLIAHFLGFIVGGLALLWIGRAIDPPSPIERDGG